VAILTTLLGLVVTAMSVARERELGTFEQLLVSPLRPFEIIVGKTVPALLIGLVEVTGMLLVGVFIFRVPFHGSIVLFYISMLVYLASVIGVVLFICSLSRTQQQAILGALVEAVLWHGSSATSLPGALAQPMVGLTARGCIQMEASGYAQA
jgi:ABC-2 type transport system permease protein